MNTALWVMIAVGGLVLLFLLRRPASPLARQDELVALASRGMVEPLAELLQLAPPNAYDRNGRLPLVEAAKAGEHEAVRVLLRSGARPELLDRAGHSPLTAAAAAGHMEVLEALLGEGAQVDVVSRGETALQSAVRNGQQPAIALLLKRGAVAYNALQDAILLGNQQGLELLIAAGCDVNDTGPQRLQTDVATGLLRPGDTRTPLMSAAAAGNARMVRTLLSAGAQPNVRSPVSGDTAATLATKKGRPDVVRLLGEAGADFSMRDANGGTPLSIANELDDPQLIEAVLAGNRRSA